MPKITFYPDNQTIEVPQGENLLRAAMLAGVHVNASCGGAATCGKCRVVVDEGAVKTTPSPRITPEEEAKGYVLACSSTVEEDVVVRVPVESRLGDKKALARLKTEKRHGRLLTSLDIEKLSADWPLKPAANEIELRLEAPSLADPIGDRERLERAMVGRGLEGIEIGLEQLKDLPHAVRDEEWKVRVRLAESERGYRLIGFAKPGARLLGVALDIGTTTLAGELVDLATGETIARAADYNAQVSCGEDVISRIVYSTKADHLDRLQRLVVETANRLVGEMLEEAVATSDEVVDVSVAGNTVMTHLFLGVDPRFIRLEPYTPAFRQAPVLRAGDLRLEVAREATVRTAPCPAAYVGGDIVAGAVAAGFASTDKLTLFIDVGTNGEMLLGNADWLLACSCSAGPAFEGGAIRHGMRASAGAIEQLRINPSTYEPMILTVGGRRAKGICGSGLIDAVAEMFATGLIDGRGKINREAETERVRVLEGQAEYVLVWAEDSDTGFDITLSEADLDNLIRTKAAVYAGIVTLLESVNLKPDDIEEIIIAGGFGHYLELDKAVIIGLLPEVAFDKVKFIGNSSLLGAKLALVSERARQVSSDIATKMTYLDLSTDARFMDRYVAALFLPHTDAQAFPGVTSLLKKGTSGTEESKGA
ncbi:MAG: ASKHA domain-containing protein [Candidatus Aquicultorales bacterium]